MINLLNESDLNRYLTNIIYGKDEVPHWVKDNTSESQDNLKNRNWVEENKDDIVRAILLQYFKKRVREYMKDKADYFTSVSEDEQNLPEWAKNALSNNKKYTNLMKKKFQRTLMNKLQLSEIIYILWLMIIFINH